MDRDQLEELKTVWRIATVAFDLSDASCGSDVDDLGSPQPSNEIRIQTTLSSGGEIEAILKLLNSPKLADFISLSSDDWARREPIKLT